MRIGFASFYAYRPHVEHIYFLSTLMKKDGHDIFYLGCDGALSNCYTLQLRPNSRVPECLKCTLGGIRSFAAGVDSLRAFRDEEGAHLALQPAEDWAFSSACTILRTESPSDKRTDGFRETHKKLAAGAAEAYAAALKWIETRNLDAVVCFNGRMEATRALLEASKTKNVAFVSVERTWFGDGLLMIPEQNCLGLAEVDRIVADYQGKPLTESQARKIGSLVAARFKRTNTMEWRAYNCNAEDIVWPASTTGLKLLITPSSYNEFDGHPDWRTSWPDQLAALDSLLDALDVAPGSCILRCHPNWGERIGLYDGSAAERMYTDWALGRGVRVIASRDTASTLSLIAQADAVVVNGGSAAFEAGVQGKQVIALGPSIYQAADFPVRYYGPQDRENLRLIGCQDPTEIARKTLRFAYAFNFRFNQYVDDIRTETTTRYVYSDDADPKRLERLLQTRRVEPDDFAIAENQDGEDKVLEIIRTKDWDAFSPRKDVAIGHYRSLHRRGVFKLVNMIRDRLPRGDR